MQHSPFISDSLWFSHIRPSQRRYARNKLFKLRWVKEPRMQMAKYSIEWKLAFRCTNWPLKNGNYIYFYIHFFSFFNANIYLSIYLSIAIASLTIYLSIYLSQQIPYLSIYLSIAASSIPILPSYFMYLYFSMSVCSFRQSLITLQRKLIPTKHNSKEYCGEKVMKIKTKDESKMIAFQTEGW